MFQADRILLRNQIAELGGHIKGLSLDVGAGSCKKYTDFFHSKRVIRLDINLYCYLVIGRALTLPPGLMGRLLMILNHFDKSKANRKHAIGWLVLAKK